MSTQNTKPEDAQLPGEKGTNAKKPDTHVGPQTAGGRPETATVPGPGPNDEDAGSATVEHLEQRKWGGEQ